MINAITSPIRYASPGVLFAEDFDTPALAARRRDLADEPGILRAQPVRDSTASEEAFARGFAEGQALGRTEGEAEGHAQAMRRSEAAAITAAEAATQMRAEITAALHDAAQAAMTVAEQGAEAIARLVLGSLSAMLPSLCADHGGAEIRALVRCVLPALSHAPRIVVRAASGAVALLREDLALLEPDLQARITIAPGDGVAEGDLRVSWQDGGLCRDAASIRQQIQEALSALGPFGTAPPAASASSDDVP